MKEQVLDLVGCLRKFQPSALFSLYLGQLKQQVSQLLLPPVWQTSTQSLPRTRYILLEDPRPLGHVLPPPGPSPWSSISSTRAPDCWCHLIRPKSLVGELIGHPFESCLLQILSISGIGPEKMWGLSLLKSCLSSCPSWNCSWTRKLFFFSGDL